MDLGKTLTIINEELADQSVFANFQYAKPFISDGENWTSAIDKR